MRAILDEQASLLIEEVLRQAGVKIIKGHIVPEILGQHLVEGAILSNGEQISCDLVVVATGVTPRTELATEVGIRVNQGIVVDRFMTTSHPDIYSCGDVAEAYEFVQGLNWLVPIWPTAYIGGRIAGYNMAGHKAEYPGGTNMNSLNYFGLNVASAGLVNPPEHAGYEIISRRKDGVYKRIVLKDDIIVGMVFAGEIEKSGLIISLMRDRINVRKFKQELLTDDFGLASLPRELWQESLRIG